MRWEVQARLLRRHAIEVMVVDLREEGFASRLGAASSATTPAAPLPSTGPARRASRRSAAGQAPSTPATLLMDAREAAGYLGISVRHLRAATTARHVACIRLRGRGSGARDPVRWRLSDLDAWVAASTQDVAQPIPSGTRGPARAAHPRRKVREEPGSAGVLSAKAALRAVS